MNRLADLLRAKAALTDLAFQQPIFASSRVLFQPGEDMVKITVAEDTFILGHPQDWARVFAAVPRHVGAPEALACITGVAVIELDPPRPELPPLADVGPRSARLKILEAVLPALLQHDRFKQRLIDCWRS